MRNRRWRPQGNNYAFFALIGHHLHEGNARGIVDADVNVRLANAEVAIDYAGLSDGDAMSDGASATDLLDVEVDQFAWVFAFVAPDRFGGLQGAELVKAEPPQETA